MHPSLYLSYKNCLDIFLLFIIKIYLQVFRKPFLRAYCNKDKELVSRYFEFNGAKYRMLHTESTSRGFK